MVTWENYEEYMIMHADGELKASEEQALRAFISEHKELEAEMALYEQVRLEPDTTEVFVNKESLLKQAPAGRVVKLAPWKTYAVAAGILALICLAAMKWLMPDASTQLAVGNRQSAVDSPQSIVGGLQSTIDSPQSIVRSPQATIGSKQAVVTAIAAPENKEAKHIKINRPAVKTNSIAAIKQTSKVLMPRETDIIPPMDIIKSGKLEQPVRVEEKIQAIAIQNVPQPTINKEESVPNNKKSLLDILNPADDDRPRLETIKNVVASSVQEVRQIKKTIKQSDISLKFGGRELAVINF